jgi:hypothetical protein
MERPDLPAGAGQRGEALADHGLVVGNQAADRHAARPAVVSELAGDDRVDALVCLALYR